MGRQSSNPGAKLDTDRMSEGVKSRCCPQFHPQMDTNHSALNAYLVAIFSSLLGICKAYDNQDGRLPLRKNPFPYHRDYEDVLLKEANEAHGKK